MWTGLSTPAYGPVVGCFGKYNEPSREISVMIKTLRD